MRFSILIPHYCTGKMTAYTIAQLLKFKGRHEIDIVVIDNKPDGSIKYLDPFLEHITIVEFPPDKVQSHGIAFDYVLPFVNTEYFITIESDGFPTEDGWLDYYEDLIERGYDAAGSLMKLSGGTYLHPCGGLFKKSVWEECKGYCESIEYDYFPNMARKNGFDSHLMVHHSILDEFMKNPDDYIELSESYKPYTPLKALEKLEWYESTVAPFHCGMGGRQESVHTYGDRTIDSDAPFAILKPKSQKLIFRVGYEPGQYFSYWMEVTGKKIFYIPTDIIWIPGHEGRQQEQSVMENGFKHLWGISSYRNVEPTTEWVRVKQRLPLELYDSLPQNQKI